MELRDYQKKAMDELWDWFDHNPGNPLIVAPTGAGKSVLLADICQKAVGQWDDTQILVLTTQKELLEQDLRKLGTIWPLAPVGIYSAGMGHKEVAQITFATIQSIARHPELLPAIDLCIFDEAHLINNNAEGQARTLLAMLRTRRPHMRVVGLTATPYRLGQGELTDGIFDKPVIHCSSIFELQRMGFLCRLKSKVGHGEVDTSSLHVRAGEFVAREMDDLVNRRLTTEEICREVVARCRERRHWLLFCTGVRHAEAVRDELRNLGVKADCVTGKTDEKERARILDDFKAGRITAVTNANVLTTGFDAPCIDLIVMLRPTLSPGLYVQMAGRGLRIDPCKQDCLVLDFVGNVKRHGPVTMVNPPARAGKHRGGGGGTGVAPCKVCPRCDEIVPAVTRVCPSCGYEWLPDFSLHDEDINGEGRNPMRRLMVRRWRWEIKESRAGNRMLMVTFEGSLLNPTVVRDFMTIWAPGWAGEKARMRLGTYLSRCGLNGLSNPDEMIEMLNKATPPEAVLWKMDGRYTRLEDVLWKLETPSA
ncbi:MAG: DEAD/DEAH box helicase [Sphaerochaetaceae bacterium]|nr:DEAD/DEAH box helicase [Spirochaetales bacterium]MDY5499955.1 DEAD/DEAH box helicase [Sphaerochaetaceae bacterium]